MTNILTNNNLKMIFEFSPKAHKSFVVDYKEYSISLLNYIKKLNFQLYHVDCDGEIELITNFSNYYNKVMKDK
jgi:hypothetical protein